MSVRRRTCAESVQISMVHALPLVRGLQWTEGTPTTNERAIYMSVRIMPIPDSHVAALGTHNGRQIEERLVAGPRW